MPGRRRDRNITMARALRSKMTLPEVLLWQLLRRQSGGVRFRRQYPIGPYVLDFYVPAAKMAIEVDGMSHDLGNRPERDAARGDWLASQRITTLRIAAAEVLADPVAVADAILRAARDRLVE